MPVSPLMPLPIPGLVGLGVEGGGTAQDSAPWDVVVGGLGFMLAASPQTPFIRRGADYRAQQINFTGEPGENGLGFWWQRAQTTWHYGAGNPTFDGEGAGDPRFASGRFRDSVGVDPWTAGELTLLKDTEKVDDIDASAKELVRAVVDGVEYVVWTDDDSINISDGVATASYDLSVISGVETVTSSGTRVFYKGGNNGIYMDDFTSATAIYTGAAGSNPLLRWVKQRLMYAQDNKVYELSDLQSPATAIPSPLFTHPNPDWVWTDFDAGPDGIYASGFAGSSSAVFKFELDTQGALPVLTGGITAVELPEGEIVHCMKSYIGLFLALGTSHGMRVCSFQQGFSGTTVVLAAPTITGQPVRDITGWDRFLYCTVDDAGGGVAGLARVDLSAEVEPGVFAWARDLRANSDPTGFTGESGSPNGVVFLNERPLFIVPGVGMFYESVDRYVPSGWLETGKILFGMTDPKVFQRAGVAAIGQGNVTLLTGADTESAVVSRFTINTNVLNNIETGIGSERGGSLVMKFQLDRDSETAAPKVLSWSAKALPSQAREDQFLIPVRCFDRVENQHGQTEYQSAITMLDSISALCQTQEPVLFQTFFGHPDGWRTRVVQVADYEFRQESSEDNWGGVLTLSLRTLEGETS
jgi:hypothetical protein